MDLFKNWLPALTTDKNNLFQEGPIEDKFYPAYMVNRAFSMREDTIFLANEMNCNSHLHPRAHFEFYLHMVPKGRNYAKWTKAGDDEKHKLVMEAFKVNRNRAQEILDMISDEDMNNIAEYLDKGGKRK